MPKTVVTVQSDSSLEATLDMRFGRTKGYLLVGEGAEEYIENPLREAAHGAGTGAAALMVSHDVTKVISGEFGPKAYQALEAAGIEMYLAPAGITAAEALARLEAGELVRKQLKVLR